jgi:hypothetical protein
MSRSVLRETGPRAELANQLTAAERVTDTHTTPTEDNVRDSDATLWFGETTTAGAQATVAACHKLGKPCMPVYPAASFDPSHVAAWIRENNVKILNVAGNREQEEPGIGEKAEQFLGNVLQQLGHQRA